jgi:hypothetical protein
MWLFEALRLNDSAATDSANDLDAWDLAFIVLRRCLSLEYVPVPGFRRRQVRQSILERAGATSSARHMSEIGIAETRRLLSTD